MTRQDILYFDFETYCNARVNHMQVYAAGFKMNHEEAVTIYYGNSALSSFMGRLLDMKQDVTCLSWNGSGFDHMLIISELVNYGFNMRSDSMVKKGKRLITFSFQNRQGALITFRDLCLLIPDSLAGACKSFNVPPEITKGDFDHARITGLKAALSCQLEVEDYLRCDVLCLEYIARAFGAIIHTHHGIDAANYLTLPHLASTAWQLSIQLDLSHLTLPTGDDFVRFKRVIRGGRCQPQLSIWEYPAMSPGHLPDWNTAATQCLTLLDANSLYPTVMAQYKGALFPSGAYAIVTDLPACAALLHRFLEVNPTEADEDVLEYGMFHVSIQCPRDLITPYLPSRSTQGVVCYDLLDKHDEVYFGFELYHAYQLGYRVTRIHAAWIWASRQNLKPCFQQFILQNMKLREPGNPPALNLTGKLMNNATFGKTIMRPIETKTEFISAGNVRRLAQLRKRQVPVTAVTASMSGMVRGYMANVPVKELKVKQPFYLGAQILARSKELMSDVLIAIDGYRDPATAFLYTDTDSLLLTAEAIRRLALVDGGRYLGNGLGQFKNDLGEGRIIAFIALAPKTYCLVYVLPNDNRLWCKTRMKGIPHRNASFVIQDIYHEQQVHDEALAAKVQQMEEILTNIRPYDAVDIRFRAYVTEWVDESKPKLVTPYIEYITYKALLEKRVKSVSVYFGALKLHYTSSAQGLSIAPIYYHRSLLAEDWWAKGKRHVIEGQEITLPPGHEDLEIEQDFDD
jgi:hypothetical protein